MTKILPKQCRQGHDLTNENNYHWTKDGYRRCNICRANYSRLRYQTNTEYRAHEKQRKHQWYLRVNGVANG